MKKKIGKNPIGVLLREPWIEKFSSLEKITKKLLDIGFTHFELPQKHFYSEAEIDFLKKLKEKKGIIYSVHSSSPCGLVNLTNPNYVNFEFQAEQLFEFAQKIGATLINFDFDICYKSEIAWERKPNLCFQRMYRTLLTRLALLKDFSKDYNIAFALENADVRDEKQFFIIRFGMKPKDFLKLAKDFPRPPLTLDTGHLYLSACWHGFNMFKDFLKPLAPFVVHVHLNSNFGKDKGTGEKDYQKGIGDLHLPLQKGILPWRKIVDFLLKQRYKGSFVLEVKPEKYEKTLKGILEEIKISYDLLSQTLKSY